MNKEQFVRLFISGEPSILDFKEAVIEYTKCTEQQFDKFLEYIRMCESMPAIFPQHLVYHDVIIQMQPHFEKQLNITYLHFNGQKILL